MRRLRLAFPIVAFLTGAPAGAEAAGVGVAGVVVPFGVALSAHDLAACPAQFEPDAAHRPDEASALVTPPDTVPVPTSSLVRRRRGRSSHAPGARHRWHGSASGDGEPPRPRAVKRSRPGVPRVGESRGRFAGQGAVVTGASSGIGRALAVALAAEGAGVWMLGRKPAALQATADAARSTGAVARPYPIDLTVDADVAAFAEHIAREAPTVHLLVHAAAIFARSPVAAAAGDEFDAQWAVNLRAPYLLTARLLPLLTAAPGQVVFLNSTAGLAGRAGVAQYSATKHALRGLADSLRDEVNASGVRVLSVFLGRTATPMQAVLHDLERRPYRPERLVQPEDVAQVVLAALAVPRTAEVTDVTIRPMSPPGS